MHLLASSLHVAVGSVHVAVSSIHLAASSCNFTASSYKPFFHSPKIDTITKRTFIDRTEDGFLNQLDNFLSKISNYSASLGLNAGKITALQNDLVFLRFIATLALSYKTTFAGLTKYKETLRFGGDVLGALPQLPSLPATLPTATSAGVEARFRELVQDVARHSAVTDAILKDLGIAATDTVVDNSVAKPTFYLELSSCGYPLIVWKKSRFEGVEIWKTPMASTLASWTKILNQIIQTKATCQPQAKPKNGITN